MMQKRPTIDRLLRYLDRLHVRRSNREIARELEDPKETYYDAKATYYDAKVTYYDAKETHYRIERLLR